MSLGGSISRSVGRSIARDINKRDRRRTNYIRIQNEAAARPESTKVSTPCGTFWMSPIELKLYKAMQREGLAPVPQLMIEGYVTDFAFPDIRLAIEADGVEYHSGDRRERDRKRDWILRKHGWTVKRFHGTTIHTRAENCVFVIKREVQLRRKAIEERERQTEAKRKARNEAIARPFQKIAQLIRRK